MYTLHVQPTLHLKEQERTQEARRYSKVGPFLSAQSSNAVSSIVVGVVEVIGVSYFDGIALISLTPNHSLTRLNRKFERVLLYISNAPPSGHVC